MLLHGDNDDSVTPIESQKIYDHLASEIKEIHFIENANHTFGITHPLHSRSEEFNIALDLTESWFDKNLLL